MLKKLVKYGNSTALVLEKPLLELLEMEEGGYVKITTDGKSLTLTPIPNSKGMGNMKEAMQIASRNMYEQDLEKKHGKGNVTSEMVDAYQRKAEAMKPIFAELFAKYNVMQLSGILMANADYQKDMTALSLECDQQAHPEEYLQRMLEVRYKYCPELKAYDDEVKERTGRFELEEKDTSK
jgi:antitoxin component of MazEF toxin-antitoxin module